MTNVTSDSYSDDIHDNLENWDDRADVHATGGYGDLDAIADNPDYISPVVRRDLAVLEPHLPNHSVNGMRLLHLQCHIGTDTLGWRRLGASEVVGLDFSSNSLAHARRLAARAHADITYVLGDARYAADALPELAGHFQVIVTSVGTITWLPDLTQWAQSIAKLLAPDGVFMIRDDHPILFAQDYSGLQLVQDYFPGTESTYSSDASYTKGSEGKISHRISHNWAHNFQELFRSLHSAGLTIEDLGEYEISEWQALPMLIHDEEQQAWVMPEGSPHIPLTFSMVARK